jgi:hypothetical protein
MADDRLETRRSIALRRARHLARSGEYEDHRGVRKASTRFPDHYLIEEWFEDIRFQAQIDQLCTIARSKPNVDESGPGTKTSDRG